MAWTENDLKNLKVKGFIVEDGTKYQKDKTKPEKQQKASKKVRIEKVSVEKNTIFSILDAFKLKNQIDDYVVEFKFDEVRRFRFDWAIPSLKLAIEYEGVFSQKSRHTTVNGFSEDCVKYNLAVSLGWRVLRYTAINYLDLQTDLEKILKNQNLNKIKG
jgi:hypothetical protein